MKQFGFLGLGNMGLPMAIQLVKKSGFPVLGFDVVGEKLESFAQAGGIPAATADEVYAECEVIFLSLPTNEFVQASIEAIVAKGHRGTAIVDLSSTAPGIIRTLNQKAKREGIHLIDCPVSGGETAAEAGTLAMMAGGDEAVFDSVAPLLQCIGGTVTYMGPSGSGSVTKLANNMIVGGYLGCISEAFAFGAKAGIDPEKLFYAIKDGGAASTILNLKGPKFVSRDFTPSARMAVHQKDLKNAVALAEEMGVEIPIASKVLTLMNESEQLGLLQEDHCAILRIYENNMGVVVGKERKA